ncbi:hypothetical protein [Imhoffiella purpurea]|uniref:Uncharacterized protein n=1 Tax=Imhoffiella purpurea TaxID=1249627 RepID=W9VU90_9GAMM|nr:hypothetical protein [Imhoffiella purpurea]EXJ13925.1 hypothetical protein D779_3125 [Imhoffiella purpurea]
MSKKDPSTHLEADSWWLIARARLEKTERGSPDQAPAGPRGAASLWRARRPAGSGPASAGRDRVRQGRYEPPCGG